MAKLTKFVYGAGVQVPSSNLNEIQEEAINRPERSSAATYGRITVGGGSIGVGGAYTSSANLDELTVDLPNKPGVRLIAFRAAVSVPAGTFTMTLYKVTAGVRGGAIATDVKVGGGAQDMVISGQTEDTSEVGVNLDEVYQIAFTSDQGGHVAYTVEMDTDLIP